MNSVLAAWLLALDNCAAETLCTTWKLLEDDKNVSRECLALAKIWLRTSMANIANDLVWQC